MKAQISNFLLFHGTFIWLQRKWNVKPDKEMLLCKLRLCANTFCSHCKNNLMLYKLWQEFLCLISIIQYSLHLSSILSDDNLFHIFCSYHSMYNVQWIIIRSSILSIFLQFYCNACREASFGNSVIVVIYSRCFTYDMK